MKNQIQKTIGFDEVDPQHRVRRKHLFNYLKDAAATHPHNVGRGTEDLPFKELSG
jgi:hypothetical protein